jgi:NitT/TauT family transport system substrate-binding protein
LVLFFIVPKARLRHDKEPLSFLAFWVRPMTLARRTLLTTSLLAAPAIWRHLNAQGLRKVTFTLPWLPEGTYASCYVAKAGGYWSKRGFDVDIARGYGALASGQAVAQGTFQTGLSNSQAVVLLASKGVELRCLGLMDYEPGMAVAVLGSSSIKTPKDLEGKTVAQTLSSSDAPFFAPFCKLNDVDISKIHLLNMDARVRNNALPQGRVDAITGFTSSIIPTLGVEKIPVRVMPYRDYGLTLYGNSPLVVRPETLEKEPELCQGILDGWLEALKFTETQPDAAQDMFLSALPELKLSPTGAEFIRLGMGVQRASFLSTNDALDHGVGWMDMDQLAKMADLVMTYQADPGTKTPDVKTLFTNRLLGKVKISPAEWQSAKAQTNWVDALIHPKG